VGAEAPSLLAGLIVDADGNRMTPAHATKKAKRYRYYVSASLLAGDHSRAQKGMRIPAGDIDALVLDRLRAFFSSSTDIGDALTPLDLEAPLMRPCATLARFPSDGSPCRPSR
jgi:site-specific DNA recombinase